jgi:hypothetical protein
MLITCFAVLCCVCVCQVTNPRWSAPEVLRNSVVSLHSDVFSFAVVMWELLTWQQPYEDMMSVQVCGVVEAGRGEAGCLGGGRGTGG